MPSSNNSFRKYAVISLGVAGIFAYILSGFIRYDSYIVMGEQHPLIEAIFTENITAAEIQNVALRDPRYINATDNSGYYPIHRSVLLDHAVASQVIPFLISKGADINQKALPRGSFGNVPTFEVTPLHIAAEYDIVDTRVVELLINMGADLTVKDSNGRTPLDRAIKSNNDAVIELLTAEQSE